MSVEFSEAILPHVHLRFLAITMAEIAGNPKRGIPGRIVCARQLLDETGAADEVAVGIITAAVVVFVAEDGEDGEGGDGAGTKGDPRCERSPGRI
eukprot:1187336-Prorocentrum_minimum.AAC.17